MTTTYTTDAQVYLRDPMASKALERVNALRAEFSLTASTLDDYRVEAQRQLLLALEARGIVLADIVRTDTLREPEVLLCLSLLYEAATVRPDGTPAPVGQGDVFASKALASRAAYDRSLAGVTVATDVRPTGSTLTWERG